MTDSTSTNLKCAPDIIVKLDNSGGPVATRGRAFKVDNRQQLLASTGLATDRRRHKRRKVLWTGRLRVAAERIECQVRNISLGGAKVQAPLDLAIGTPVHLESDHHPPLFGRIAWRHGDMFGIAFDRQAETITELLGLRVVSNLHLDDDQSDITD